MRLYRDEITVGDADLKACWTRIGEAVAVLVGCNPDVYEQRMEIYSGPRTIYVDSLYTRDGKADIAVRTVVRSLRPLNRRAPWPLVRPNRLSCRELGRVAKPYRRHMPSVLRPKRGC